MTTFNYTLFDLQNPAGRNGLSSFAMYFQRAMYKEAVYPTNIPAPLDTWYDKQYYGRVDQQQNTIIPSYDNLAPLTTVARQNLFALNFVAQAFEDFASHMRNATILGVLATDGTNEKIFNPEAYQAYNDPTRMYSDYTQQLYNSFVDGLSLDESNKITNFESFTKTWFGYLKTVADFIPVTKTNYLLTGMGNTFNSGLSVALDLGPAADDSYKYDNWLNDYNFAFYVKVAKKFGFTVSKNTPWVLTADLFSDAITKYFSDYYVSELQSVVTEDNFFDVYFDKTCITDIGELKQLTANAYSAYIQNNPIYQQPVFNTGCDKYVFETFVRPPLPDSLSVVMSDKALMDLYVSLRSLEASEPVQVSAKLKTELANIYTVRPDKSLTGLENAANYINTIYRDYLYSFGYVLNNIDALKNLDNRVRTGNIATVGSITQTIY